ncbi:reverse transcriptase domain-containing protein [uncultured Clostridium sp.]|uniref:reverse transcriptase domain-containing protein n=1 Tax=uncultured Clostridium sp. TaxID=59620 RepID=UPI0028ECF898|nr:reverse transcriptase domain-containing protein [uncultured Clostridium sp.]
MSDELILDGSTECFKKIFFKYITPNSAKGIDNINFEKYKLRVDENSELIAKKIRSGNYKFSYFREKLILKGRKKEPRIISIPTIRDKIVFKYIQLLLKNQCADIIQKIPQFYINEFKKNIINYNYLIKLDISKYYDTIKHDILIDILTNMGVEDFIIKLIKNAISTSTINDYELYNKKMKKENNKKGAPQGLSISNILAAIYIKEIDDLFNKKQNIKYIRYVDDIIILCNEDEASSIYDNIVNLLYDKLRLEINTNKEYKHKIDNKIDVSFLGYNYRFIYNKFNGFTIKNENLYKFENSIVNIFTRFESDKNMSEKQFVFVLNNKITGSISKKIDTDNSRESKYGWLFFYSQIDDYTIPYKLDQLLDKLLNRFKRCSGIKRNKIKSFIKTFGEIRSNIKYTNYIHRPDELNINQRRQLLVDVFEIHINKLKKDSTVDKLYYKFVYKPIKLLQKDIQQIRS